MTSPPAPGAPDRFRKIDLQCADNSSLVVFDELQRTDMNCMLEEFMKEDSGSSLVSSGLELDSAESFASFRNFRASW